MQVFCETPRLVLRQFTMADVDNLVNLDADPDVMHFVTGGIPTAREEKAGLTLVRSFHQPWPYPIDGDDQGDVEYALDRADWERQLRAAGDGAETP